LTSSRRGRQGFQFGFRFGPGQRAQGRSVTVQALRQGGDNADLKNWAGKTLPALQHHLEMAQALKKQAEEVKSTSAI
jgi:putative membrane protein